MKNGWRKSVDQSPIKDVSLERRLYSVVVMTSCLALLLAYLAFVVNDLYTFRRNQTNSMLILADVTARNSVGAVSFADDETARNVLQALRTHSHIRHAVVLNADGTPFVEFRNNWVEASQARVIAEINWSNDKYMQLSRPIELDTITIGHVYLLVDLEEQRERVYRFVGIGALILLLALLGSLFLSRRLIRSVSSPIFNLVSLAEKVGRDKNYQVKAELTHIIELNTLVLSINNMLKEIDRRDNALIENEKQLRLLANFDSLTQLPNRGMFMDRLTHAVHMSKRTNTLMAVLFIDLDGFKQINDTLGHKVGDELLRQVAQRMSACKRESDTVARLAGDEFTLILENLYDDHDAEFVAKKILSSIKESFLIYGRTVYVGASIGISVFPHDADDGDSLLHHADAAMYFSKNHGRNRYEFYDPQINVEIDRRNHIENDLRRAIGSQQISVLYQPKVDAVDYKIIGFEALLRWTHPHFGDISPVEFIAIAESSGLIKPLGEWVLREACFQLKQWHQLGYNDLSMAVNVSAKQFHLTDFPLEVAYILRDEALEAKYVELELTESLIMDNPERVILMLHTLKNLGVNISIDDFGTGYSSLSYLQRFPIDTLKVDRSFVSAIDKSDDGRAIASAIISMAHNLNLQVIAEGVETESQLQFLQAHHCEQLQGFYFSCPISADQALAGLLGCNGYLYPDNTDT